ncbi:MAG: 2-amino-4-hydroxy-6-hydroxymethyldihydropteridine diphosphokinase, partial [Bacteroides graminisolvens]
ERLTEIYPSVRFSEAYLTAAEGLQNPSPFLNQVAVVHTRQTAHEVRATLKELEREAGRLPAHKQLEVIKLDADLLQFNDRVLKPADMQRSYVQRGMAQVMTNE